MRGSDITLSKPTQNAYIESFNGKFRSEFLDQHWFSSLAEVKNLTRRWRKNYNEERPHSSLGYLTPREFVNAKGLMNSVYNYNCYQSEINL